MVQYVCRCMVGVCRVRNQQMYTLLFWINRQTFLSCRKSSLPFVQTNCSYLISKLLLYMLHPFWGNCVSTHNINKMYCMKIVRVPIKHINNSSKYSLAGLFESKHFTPRLQTLSYKTLCINMFSINFFGQIKDMSASRSTFA
jgi:hypothetical protein